MKQLNKRGAYTGVYTSSNFKGRKIATRGQFHKILINLYGKDVTGDLDTSSKVVLRQKYLCKTLSKVSKKLGSEIKWSNVTNAKVTRGQMAYIVWRAIRIDKYIYDPVYIAQYEEETDSGTE